MEETSYHRKALAGSGMKEKGGDGLKMHKHDMEDDSVEKYNTKAELDVSANTDEEGIPDESLRRKSFYDKLKVFDTEMLRYTNRLKDMIQRPLIS